MNNTTRRAERTVTTTHSAYLRAHQATQVATTEDAYWTARRAEYRALRTFRAAEVTYSALLRR